MLNNGGDNNGYDAGIMIRQCLIHTEYNTTPITLDTSSIDSLCFCVYTHILKEVVLKEEKTLKPVIVEYWGDNNGYDAGCHYETTVDN